MTFLVFHNQEIVITCFHTLNSPSLFVSMSMLLVVLVDGLLKVVFSGFLLHCITVGDKINSTFL